MKEKIIKFKFPLIIIGIILIPIIIFFILNNPQKQAANTSNIAPVMEAEVDVVTIEKKIIKSFKEFPARISASQIVQVKPQISGIIRKILFNEGAKINKGQTLYKIEPEVYQANLKSAKTKYNAALANFKRAEILIKEEAISQKEFDDVKSELNSAKAELESAKINFSYTQVLAPISGYISISNLNEGALVTANQANPLATITALDLVDADISIPSKDFEFFKNQKDLEVLLVINEQVIEEKGVLKFSEVFVDTSTDSIKMHAEFKNKNEKLLDGMFAKAQIFMPESLEILIPQKATIRGTDGSLSAAKVFEGNIVKFVEIKTKGIFKDNWIIESGIDEGDLIIIAGYQKVKDGAKVKVNLK